jgi:hypothetical protein
MTLYHAITIMAYVYLTVWVAEMVTFTAGRRKLADVLQQVSYTLFAVIIFCFFLDREWVHGAIGVAVILFLAWLDRRKRKPRKAGEALGAKAKARRAALVQRARESFRPRPQRVPVPVRES